MANWGLAGESFILPSPWGLVTPPVTTTTTTTSPPIGPLGFSITALTPASTAASVVVKTGSVLEDVKSVDPAAVTSAAVSLLSDLLQPALLSLLSLWLLAGGLWAFLTHLSINSLRRELESVSFLFMPQATIHQLSKSSMKEAVEEMDRILAKLFMNLPPEKTSKVKSGPLDLVLRALMLLLSLSTGLLQSTRHLLGMLIMKTIPVGGMPSVETPLAQKVYHIRKAGLWRITTPGWTTLRRPICELANTLWTRVPIVHQLHNLKTFPTFKTNFSRATSVASDNLATLKSHFDLGQLICTDPNETQSVQ